MTPTPIFGHVRDDEGRPVANARASFVRGPGNLPDIAMLTDATGKFSLTAPGSGEFVIQIHADGFQPAEISVSVRSGEQKNVDVTLSK
jgi:hypothetical protein